MNVVGTIRPETGATNISRNVYKYKMVDWKRDEDVGEEYGMTCITILILSRQKYVVTSCGKNA